MGCRCELVEGQPLDTRPSRGRRSPATSWACWRSISPARLRRHHEAGVTSPGSRAGQRAVARAGSCQRGGHRLRRVARARRQHAGAPHQRPDAARAHAGRDDHRHAPVHGPRAARGPRGHRARRRRVCVRSGDVRGSHSRAAACGHHLRRAAAAARDREGRRSAPGEEAGSAATALRRGRPARSGAQPAKSASATEPSCWRRSSRQHVGRRGRVPGSGSSRWSSPSSGLAVVGVLAMRRTTAVTAPPPATIPPPPSTPPLDPKVANVRRITSGDGCEEFPHFTPDGRSVVYDETVGRDAFVYQLDLAPERRRPADQAQVHGWDIAPSGLARRKDGGLRALSGRAGSGVRRSARRFGASALRQVRGSVRPSWSRDGKAIWAGSGAPLAAYDVSTGALVSTRKGAPPLAAHGTDRGARCGGDLVTLMTLSTRPCGSKRRRCQWRSSPRTEPRGGCSVVTSTKTSPSRPTAVTCSTRASARRRASELVDQPTDGSPEASLAGTGTSPRKGISAVAGRFAPRVVRLRRRTPDHRLRRGRQQLRRAVDSDMPEVSFVAGARDDAGGRRGGRAAESPNRGSSGSAATRCHNRCPWAHSQIRDVAISHDGTRLAVSVLGDGLYAGGLRDGRRRLRRLTVDGTDAAPAFRAGDAQVVFTRHTAGTPSVVMTAPFAGGEAAALLGSDSDAAGPSPRGEQIVYLHGASLAEDVPEVWYGHASRPLSSQLTLGRYGTPRFSPDGRRVAIVRGDARSSRSTWRPAPSSARSPRPRAISSQTRPTPRRAWSLSVCAFRATSGWRTSRADRGL